MAFLAIMTEVFRHAWRLRLPAVFGACMLLLTFSLPSLLKSDGSAEGRVRLFLTYYGHFQVIVLALISVVWTVWLQKYEQKKNLHLLIATRPIKRSTVLIARFCAINIIILFFSLCFNLCAGIVATGLIENSEDQAETKNDTFQRLKEVNSFQEISFAEEQEIQEVQMRRTITQGIPMAKGKTLAFIIEKPGKAKRRELRGSLRSISLSKETNLFMRLRKGREALWISAQTIKSGKTFYQKLPEIPDSFYPLPLELKQESAKGSTVFYYLPKKPLMVSTATSSVISNYLRSSIMIMGLCATLIALSFFFSQFLSLQGSFLVISLIFLIGCFKSDIYQLLFPTPMPTSMPQPPNLSFVDLFYRMVWEPLLFLTPDFYHLNPTPYLSNSELISWQLIGSHFLSIIPFLIILSLYLFYFVPKQELGASRE
ncbi:MAG: hypothetical protein HQL32_14100 [Planctomycetes bacterium]|nr:hypothetical protein [Planctomycetota bacterium]